jgi:WD40 repeat protein
MNGRPVDPSASSWDQLAASLLPKGFGSNKEGSKTGTQINPQLLEKAIRKEAPKRSAEDTEDIFVELPVTHSIKLKQHKKTVSALDVDRSGARLVTGSHDSTVALWDFAGMDAALAPFRYNAPVEGCPVRFLKFSGTGDTFLIGSGGTIKLLDRNGRLIVEYAKGDPYLRDMKGTIGHVGAVHCGDWEPSKRDHFVTAGQDGTIRFWITENRRTCNAILPVKSRSMTGGKPAEVTQVKYTPDGSAVICAVSDGSIRIYPTSGPWFEPSAIILDAHEKGTDTTCLAIDTSGRFVTSRGGDDTLKLWDVRNFKIPIGTVSDLSNAHMETSCVFSPDQRLIATGCSVRRGSGMRGTITVFDSINLTRIADPIPVTESSVVSLSWPSALDQIIAGNADGSVNILFNPVVSQKGALLPLTKTPSSRTKEAVVDFAASVGTIQTPNALPLFQDDEDAMAPKRLRIKARKDPILSHRPEQPIEGPGSGGRIGSSVTQSIMRHVLKDTQRDVDPREALLKYAEIAEKEPLYVTPAYQHTQPKTLFDEEQLKRETEVTAKRQQEEDAAALLSRKIQDRKQ